MENTRIRFDLTHETCLRAFYEAARTSTYMSEVAEKLDTQFLPFRPDKQSTIGKAVVARALRNANVAKALEELFPGKAANVLTKFQQRPWCPATKGQSPRRAGQSCDTFSRRSVRQGEFKDLTSALEPLGFENGSPATIGTLNDSMCNYPYAHEKHGFVYCGRRREVGSYCAVHADELGVGKQPKAMPNRGDKKLNDASEHYRRRQYVR